MIAASRLKRAQDRVIAARPFAQRMLRVLNGLVAASSRTRIRCCACRTSPTGAAAHRDHRRPRPERQLQFERHQGGGAVHRRRRARPAVRARADRPQGARLLPPPRVSTCATRPSASSSGCRSTTPRTSPTSPIDEFTSGKASSVYLVYNEFKSVMSQRHRRRAPAADSAPRGQAAAGAAGVRLSVRAGAAGDLPGPAAAPRAGAGLSRAARIERGVLRGADDRDGLRHAQFGGDDREPDALYEQGAAGGDHPRNHRSRIGRGGDVAAERRPEGRSRSRKR